MNSCVCTLVVFSGITDRSVVIVSTHEYTAWSGLVSLHFSTGGLVCKLGTTFVVPVREASACTGLEFFVMPFSIDKLIQATRSHTLVSGHI